MNRLWRSGILFGLTVIASASMGGPIGAQESKPAQAPDSRLDEVDRTEPPPTAEQLEFFEKRIRPVLVKECYACHAGTAKEVKSGLTIDTRAGLRLGGDRGPAIVLRDAKHSLLIEALHQTDPDLSMPPKKKLPADVIADFEAWIDMGAPDPRDGPAKGPRPEINIAEGKKYWAFQPRKPGKPSVVQDPFWSRSPIDQYLLAAMESRGIQPVGDADAATIYRRVWFDLVGLPPPPEELESFQAAYESDPDAALAEVVETLLAAPQFGERWGRHWLDVARYAESSGRSVNFAYPQAWRYRDYVVTSFNADKPYNQFVREQIAGDLLQARSDAQRAEFQIATGFLAIGAKTHDQRNARQFQMDLVDEQIDATFQAFQALTVACARCHDHKFDPIPQKDYYALAGIFRSSETCYGTIRIFQNNHPSPLLNLPSGAEVPTALDRLSDARRESLETQVKDLRKQASEMTGQDSFIRRILITSRATTLQSQIDQYTADGVPKSLAMGMRDRQVASDTQLLVRGELDQPGERVRRGFPQVLSSRPVRLRGSGRRELAEFLASPNNPLTARVMANRVWLHLMGRGIVATPDNFGASGQRPSHPELLDYLAESLVRDDWSVKSLVRDIVLTRAYRMSSQIDHKNVEADPENVFVWHMPKRRLEAEALRDSMLLVGGQLDLRPRRGSSVARNGEGNAGARLRGPGGDSASGDAYRTIYSAIVRDALPESLTLFDFPDPTLIMGERDTTTVPAQSLYLLNNQFVIRQAESLADRLISAGDTDEEMIRRTYQSCFSRNPSATEVAKALEFIADYGRRHSRRSTWSALAQAFLASAEFSQR